MYSFGNFVKKNSLYGLVVSLTLQLGNGLQLSLKIEEAMTSAEINAELVCPLRTPNFPPGTHDYDPKRHDFIEVVSECMISGQEAQAKFNEFREAQGSHDEVYIDGSKMNERVGTAVVINRHFQNGETACCQLS